jgi:twitching motility protein PilT
MYPRDRRNGEESSSASNFGDAFLGAMEDELDSEELAEEGGLPPIDEEILDSGASPLQKVVLKEASLDEPLPGMDKVYIPREKDWDYATADFHGAYEADASSFEADAQSMGSQDRVLPSEPQPAPYHSRVPFELESDDDALAMLDAIAGKPQTYERVEPTSDPVDTERAFDDVEDQEDDEDDLASILANIDRGYEDEEDDDPRAAKPRPETNFRITDEDEELMQGFEIDEIISFAIDQRASDIHINPNQRIGLRINGSIHKIDRFEPIPGEITRRIQQKIVTNVADDIFLKNWELDTSYTVKSGPHRGRRVRVSVTKGFEEVVMVMRIISQDIPLPHELEIEDELLEWSELPNGLVLMNGPTGTGKSTTLASIIQDIQMKRNGVIVTVEKPVEYMYRDQGLAMVYQREVGRDTLSFAAALDSAMRMDPDVILIGETRNSVEMDALLYAADTGHLSLSTTHANSTSETINRVKRMYAGDERRQALESLSAVARGFAAQVLCKTVDGNGRFAVREVLTVDREVSDLIIEGDNRGIRRLQEERGSTLDHGLVRAVSIGRTTVAEARAKSPSPRYFDALLADQPKIL